MTTTRTIRSHRRPWGLARRALPLLLSVTVSACPGYDPPHGDMVLHNRSDQPVYVYFERFSGEESLQAGPVEPDQDAVFFVLSRGEKCLEGGTFMLRDAQDQELARRDMATDPVCDGEPWVWTGDTDEANRQSDAVPPEQTAGEPATPPTVLAATSMVLSRSATTRTSTPRKRNARAHQTAVRMDSQKVEKTASYSNPAALRERLRALDP